MDTTLHIVVPLSNPLLWRSRGRLARQAIADWLKEPNVLITLVECAYGARDFELVDLASERLTHIGVRANTMAWSKENLCNIGVTRLPASARYIGFFDADIFFRKPGWAERAVHALQLYPVIQPWGQCLDMGPDEASVIATHKSFASLYHAGAPVAAKAQKWWQGDGGPYQYAHSGFAWAWTRDALNRVGGLFEEGGMGSGDYHMALGLVGLADHSIVAQTSAAYEQAVMIWQQRALTHVNRKIGWTAEVIDHGFHGRKGDRGYLSRWDMFMRHGFDPSTDLKRNTYGVIEFAGNKPDLEREFDLYLRSRNEDVNTLS